MSLQEQIHRLWSLKQDDVRIEEIIVILSELLSRVEALETKGESK